MNNIPFQTIDWSQVEAVKYEGTAGFAFWQTIQLGNLRLRLVEYSTNYEADHWCSKGHIVHCLEGSFESILKDGETFTLTKGMSYIVSDDLSIHKSISTNGVKLLIIDGDF